MSESLGHYRLLRPIGKGAMGEVFLAEDSKLDRQVALKVLPASVAGNPDRLARFQREAKAAAAVTHPGIVTLFTIEDARDEAGSAVHFLTMELVDGGPLSEHLSGDGLPPSQLLDWGIQLADAVAAAHDEGIIHRDLKPANIMVTSRGRLKILDFGLARGVVPPGDEEPDTEAPTSDGLLTREGQVMGTPAYMSPEQADGRAVDHRSDIFSLGVVLYEMAAGKRPFGGKSPASIMSAILRDDPAPLAEQRPELPAELDRIVGRCLAKPVDQRFQTAHDVRDELEALRRALDSASASGVHVAPRRSLAAPFAIAAAGLAVAAAIWFGTGREAPAGPDPADPAATIALRPERLTDLPGTEMYPSLSSDGKTLLFAHKSTDGWGIYRQRIGGEPILLTGDHDGDDTMPTVSPDDELVAFRSERDGGGLFVMGATGESVRRISDFGYNPSWSPDGRQVVFATQPSTNEFEYGLPCELWVTDVVGGEPRRIEGAEGAAPAWSPDGTRIAYATKRENRQRDVLTISVDGGEPVAVTDSEDVCWGPEWAPDGRHLYFHHEMGGNRGFSRVAIDQASGETRGEPQPVTTTTGSWQYQIVVRGGVAAYSVMNQRPSIGAYSREPSPGGGGREHRVLLRETEDLYVFDTSPDGEEALAQLSVGGLSALIAVATDGSGRREIASGRLFFPRFSPDGERIALVWKRGGDSYELFTMRRDGSDLRTLTHNPESAAGYPAWSPDGERIVYWASLKDHAHVVPASGDGGPVPFGTPLEGGERLQPSAWSADGSRLLGTLEGGGLLLLDLTTGDQQSLRDSGRWPQWLDAGAIAFQDAGVLYRLDLASGEVAPLLEPGVPDDFETYFTLGDDAIVYSRGDRQYDIWSVRLP